MLASLVTVWQYHIVALICLSLMTNEVWHLSMCLLAILDVMVCEVLFKSFAHLCIGLSAFALLTCKSSFYILGMSSLMDMCIRAHGQYIHRGSRYPLSFCGVSNHKLLVLVSVLWLL